MATLSDLPAPLRALAARAADSAARQVRITQRGQMWLKPGARAMPFTAVQHIAVDRVAYSWKARFPLLGPLALRVVDDYDAGAGALTVSLFGLPLQRQRNRETSRGEALRYLAELPFVPPALVMNELEFQEIDNRHVEVAATIASQRLTVTLELDERGTVVRTSSTMRKFKRDGEWHATPWGVGFRDYAQIGPLYLPTARGGNGITEEPSLQVFSTSEATAQAPSRDNPVSSFAHRVGLRGRQGARGGATGRDHRSATSLNGERSTCDLRAEPRVACAGRRAGM